ncbi:hypothetical protein [Actinoplanes couchii]|uniref:Uncharacterized protein n=1 Tax=Actinoplanes couchii TaxID=403638 RepID=A0ABQ3XAB2_9ACTN|nr:hypothetical protein [Actinoplanes couchii]MDR6324963.1 hypothetical protein [Actinoplanes couchii]GID55416.1 hypothetical protein Aco03nite_038200 [Actinoplanes couchii]
MIKPSVLLFALLISAPAWYRLILDEIDLVQVLIRFLIAVPIAAVLLAGLRFVLAGYRKSDEEPGSPITPERYDSPEPGKAP